MKRSAVGLVLLVATACGMPPGGSSSSSTGGTGPQPVSATLGTAGGSVQTANGEASLDIPAGAIPADVTFTIDPLPTTPVGAVGTAYEIGPDGTTFSAPVTLALRFDPAALAGALVSEVRLAYHDGTTWQVMQESVVDSAQGKVTAPVRHLSTWGVVVADSCSVPDTAACGTGCSISCAGSTPVAHCEAAVLSGSSCARAPSCECRAAEDEAMCSVPDTAGCGRGCSTTCAGSSPVAVCRGATVRATAGGQTECLLEAACNCAASGAADGGTVDAGISDGSVDGGTTDGGTDAGPYDGGTTDGGTDAGPYDGGITDGGTDAGPYDGGITDGGTDAGWDGSVADAG